MATRRMPPKLKPLLGTVLCGALAVAISLMGQGKPGKSTLPIWFLAAVMLIIFRFGSLAGVLGTIASGIIFAVYLFEPLGQLAVHNEVQKNNLIWMVLVGLALSIFGCPPEKKPTSLKEDTR
jgi:K+-sensing histidine kinase KdpD